MFLLGSLFKRKAKNVETPLGPAPITKYRIVHYDRHTCRLEYLHNDVWHMIPTLDTAHLDKEWILGCDVLFSVHSYNDENELRSFASRWPDIDEYFKKMRIEQRKWLEKNLAIDKSTKYL